MSKISFSLEEQFSDLRSHEIPYKFLIDNQENVPISIKSIIPRIPKGVEPVDVKDPSSQETLAKLLSDLTQLFNKRLKS